MGTPVRTRRSGRGLARLALAGGAALLAWLAPLPADAQVISGSYTGNGAARTIAVGFQPVVVIIKRDGAFWGMARTASMAGDTTKPLNDFPAVATIANAITSLIATGFTLGTDATVNGAGGTFYWVAFGAAPGDLAVGSYVGNGTAGRLIGVGFQPSAVITLPATNQRALLRTSTMGADTCYNVDATEFGPAGNRVQVFGAGTFQIGSNADVNRNGDTYHYIAWRAVAGKMAVGSYPGNGADNRNLDVIGFRPEWLMVKRGGSTPTTRPWMHKPASTGLTTDYGLFLSNFAGTANGIQSLRPLGFQVGTGPWTNTSGLTYHWFAFGNLATAVELLSFAATARDGAVELSWRTGSELRNLGFHLYRSLSRDGPYERVTSSVIPGLGSSAEGASYAWADGGLVNGVAYFYKLEDIETTGRTETHGPVWATPQAASLAGGRDEAATGAGALTATAYGDPSSVSLRVLERTPHHALLELQTGGFHAVTQPDGSVAFEIPGLEEILHAGLPALPVKRAVVDAVVGKGVRVGRVRRHEVLSYPNLVPAVAGSPELGAGAEDVVSVRMRRSRRARPLSDGFFPESAARVAGTAFQGEAKKALVELWPLRWNGSASRLELARRLVVRLDFVGSEGGEVSRGGASRGRRVHRLRSRYPLLASIVVRERGLHAVAFEALFGPRYRPLAPNDLRLSRQGEPVAFHVEPDGSSFGPGSVLYFFSEGPSLNPYGNEVVYQLGRTAGGQAMPLVSAFPSGDAVSFGWGLERFEQDKTFQPGLLEAPDIWLWQSLTAPARKSFGFGLPGLVTTSEPSRLDVFLQGGSDQDGVADHHVRVWVNGTAVGEASWDGQTAHALSVPIGPGILREADNGLELESVGDAGASHSLLFLDRFEVAYPRALSAPLGSFEAGFSRSGSAEVSGLGADSLLLDVTSPSTPTWLFGASPTATGAAFRAEADRRYLALARPSVLRPEVLRPLASTLRRTTNRADYLLIAPRAFLSAAQPLLDLRAAQGLAVQAAALEEVYQEFGYGEATPQAIRDFIAYAYHSWQSPSARYVALLGDASYDYKNRVGGAAANLLPARLVKTSFLWTASDPAYAAVNGEDLLPDLAVGRLPAASVAEAEALVEKIVAFESSGRTLADAAAVLVADNPDPAGDFEQSARDAAALVAGTHTVENVFLRELGSGGTRPTIAATFDRGASLVSYLGHGGIAVWASENVFNNQDVALLGGQAQQPLLLTMNCLNGYFHFPFLNALAEELAKAPGKGAIASFAPSGFSLHAPADLFHQALLRQVTSGAHDRLGDAIFAAQVDYAATGAFPELLSVYNLLGDPALKIR